MQFNRVYFERWKKGILFSNLIFTVDKTASRRGMTTLYFEPTTFNTGSRYDIFENDRFHTEYTSYFILPNTNVITEKKTYNSRRPQIQLQHIPTTRCNYRRRFPVLAGVHTRVHGARRRWRRQFYARSPIPLSPRIHASYARSCDWRIRVWRKDNTWAPANIMVCYTLKTNSYAGGHLHVDTVIITMDGFEWEKSGVFMCRKNEKGPNSLTSL